MKKETIQIVVGVFTVAIIGTGVAFAVHHYDKSVPKMLIEKLSESNRDFVLDLHPNARKKFAEFINKVEKLGYTVVITSGYRTFEKQKQLHNENPSNAKAGYSNHNYGYAIDINVVDNKTGKTLKKASSDAEWKNSGIIKLAKDMGISWGGDFKNYHDPIHFYIERDKTTAQMLDLVNKGKVDKEGYVLAVTGQPNY